MFHRILMRVIQPRQIGLLVSQSRIPIIEPDFSARRLVKAIDPFRGLFVQQREHGAEVASVGLVDRRVRNEVVMIREHCPSLQLPAEIARQPQKTTMQHCQPASATEMMSRLVSSRGDEVGSLVCQLMRRCVRPGKGRCWHEAKVRNRHVFWQGCENTLAVLDCGGRDTAFEGHTPYERI